MNADGIFATGVVERLGWMLVHSIWEGAVGAIFVGVLLRFLRGAAVRYAGACIGLVLMAGMVVGTFFVMGGGGENRAGNFARGWSVSVTSDGGNQPQRTQSAQRFLGDGESDGGGRGVVGDARGVGGVERRGEVVVPWREIVLGQVREEFPWMVGIRFFGVVGVSLWHVGGWVLIERMRRVGVERVGERVEGMVWGLAERMGVRKVVRVVKSGAVGVPVVVGHFRPMILVPASVLSGLSVGQLEAILAHEMAHVRRHDYLVNLLQTVVETVLFYHPAVWWISRRVREEREHCCDDVASAVCGDRAVYAEALLQVDELRGGSVGLGMAASGGGEMFLRVQRVLGIGRDGGGMRMRSLVGILLVMMGVVGLSWVEGRGERSVSAAAPVAATMPAEVTLRGRLLEIGTEKPVAGARVDANCEGYESRIMTTDGEGAFTCKLGRGAWEVRFIQVGPDVYVTEPVDDRTSIVQMELLGSEKERVVVLHIPAVKPAGGVHGKVLMPDGSPAAGILVVPSGEDDTRQITNLIYMDARKTEADGTFAFKSAPAGVPVHLYAETGDRKLAFWAEVPTKANVGEQDLGTFRLGPTVSADLVVTDAHREPLVNERINVSPTFGDNGLGNKSRKLRTDERGHLVVDGVLPGLAYKVSRPGVSQPPGRSGPGFDCHVNVMLAGKGAVGSVLLDKYFSMRVVDGAGKGVAVSDIKLITVKMTDGDWQDGPKPEILGRLADETVLVDPEQMILANPGNAVTMRFVNGAGEMVVARGTYGGLSGMVLRTEGVRDAGVMASKKEIAVGKGDFGGRVVDESGAVVTGATISAPDFSIPFTPGKMKVLATTDGAGEFHFAAVGHFYLQVEKEGFAPRWALQADLLMGKAFDLVLEKGTRVEMDLKLADGSPAAGAVLTGVTTLEDMTYGGKTGPFEVSAVADGAGRVELPVSAGTWEFRVGWKDQQFGDVAEMEVRRGEVVKKEMVLSPGVRVKVRAVDSKTGAGIAGVKLMFESVAFGAVVGMPETEIVTGGDGRAEWGAVGPWVHGIEWQVAGYARCLCDEAAWPDERGIDGVWVKVGAGDEGGGVEDGAWGEVDGAGGGWEWEGRGEGVCECGWVVDGGSAVYAGDE